MRTLPLEYGHLMHELHRRAAERRQAINGTFELTNRCNLTCRMCYTRHSACNREVRNNELSASAWLSLARQAVENGMVFLLLTSGEPFLRPDFFQIYEPLTRMGLILTLFTNGTLITEPIAERLAQAPPNRTEITLYGATAITYEAVTGVPGSYARCCAGIEALAKRGVPLGLKTTITRQNVAELGRMREMAHQWGLPFSASWLLSPRPDGTPSEVEKCRLSGVDCVDLEATDHTSANGWIEISLKEPNTTVDSNFNCNAGKAAFVINTAGDMNVCLVLPHPAAKPLEIGFANAWAQIQRYVDTAPPLASTCLACDASVYCKRCPAWSLMDNGTLSDPVPYLCEIAFARKEHYG